MVGGPLDRGRRGQGSVQSHRCNWAAKKHVYVCPGGHIGLDTPHRWLGNTWPMLGGVDVDGNKWVLVDLHSPWI